ncbi:MAG: hypothetical protein WA156_05415 [Methylocystis silviterrae]
MAKFLKLIFERLKSPYVTYLNSTDEYWQNDLDANFNSGKKLSDFIGMIVRLGFTGLAIRYFFSKSLGDHASDRNSFITWVCGVSGVLAAAVYFALAQKIYNIMHGYFMAEITMRKSAIWKIYVIVSTIVTTGALNYGIWMLVIDFPSFKATTVAPTKATEEKQ